MIHNGLHSLEPPAQLNLDKKTVSMEAVGVDGQRSIYDLRNIDGTLMEKHVRNAVAKLHPREASLPRVALGLPRCQQVQGSSAW